MPDGFPRRSDDNSELIRRPEEAVEKGLDAYDIAFAVFHEKEMARRGARRFRKWCEKQLDEGTADRTPGGRELAFKFIGPITESIVRFQRGEAGLLDKVTEAAIEARGSKRQSRRGASYRELIDEMDPLMIAGTTFSIALSEGLKNSTLTSTAGLLADALEEYALIDTLKEEHRRLAESVLQQSVKRRDPKWKLKEHLRTAINNTRTEWEHWDRREAMKLAVSLIRLVTDITGMVTLKKRYTSRRKRVVELHLHDEAKELVENKNARTALFKADLEPFHYPPCDWIDPRDGVFWSGEVKGVSLIGHDFNSARLDALDQAHRKGNLDTVYSAINTLQATPFRVNRRVLEVMRYLWDADVQVGEGMVKKENRELPPQPAKDASEEVWQSWKAEAAKVHQYNRSTLSKRLAFGKTLDIALKYRDEEAFWFGWRCDFRGRMYPLQAGLSPQGAEHEKALLEFGEGLPIHSDTSEQWLAVHGANCWGEDVCIQGYEGKIDKGSFPERCRWVLENTKKILACAEDPITTTWWRQAADPWLFLAFCFDWAGWCKRGEGYISHLPIAIDGTCNGLQHLSAMTRDEVGGAAVNLLPSIRPNDIYQDVADALEQRLRQTVQAGGGELGPKFARGAGDMLEFGFDRKVTKRTVMTIPYGLSQHSANDYIREALEAQAVKTGKQAPWRTLDGDLDRDRIEETRTHFEIELWNAVKDTIGSAMGAMEWMQACCDEVVGVLKTDFRWTAPSGFPVLQRYRKHKGYRLDINNGTPERTAVTVQLPTSELSKKDHKNGAAPNIVHSFDAAHMVATINACTERGVTSFAMVHDSFGCHAANMEVLHECTRNAFADMYERDQIARLMGEWLSLAEGDAEGTAFELPAAPERGLWDPDSTRQSDMFFS